MRNIVAVILTLASVCTATATHAEGSIAETHRFYEVRGAKVYVQTYGSGTPIVFLHGGIVFFDNNFSKQRDYFASFRKVIGIDRRGHGHSPDNQLPFSYHDMAEETAALIEQLGVAPVDVVGHSDGGNIGLLLARDHPRLIRRLVISGANMRVGLDSEERQRQGHWTPEQAAEKVRQLNDQLPPSFRTDYEKVAPDGPEHWWTLLYKSHQMWLASDILQAADLKKIKVPVLVMAGDHDFTSIEETVESYRGLEKGQLIIIPGTGHGTMRDRPDLVNLAIREFVERPEADLGVN